MKQKYLYPFEVVRLRGCVYQKSFLLDLLENGTCCACGENMMSCECGANEDENKKVCRASREVLEMRTQFWKKYDGDPKDNRAIASYAKDVARYHEHLNDTKQKEST